jgi:subtilisin family serine protease
MRGAAPRATILPLKVYNQDGSAWYSWWISAFLYVAELKRSGALPGPVVLNLSGGGPFDQTADDALNYMLAQGVLFVTITHNFGDAGLTWPGTEPESITAGASGFAGQFSSPLWYLGDVPEDDPAAHFVAYFSGRELPGLPTASQIDLIAPGDYCISCWGFGNGHTHTGYAEGNTPLPSFRLGIAYLFGSSFAAPHATAVVAQMLQHNPSLTQAQVEAILRSTALPIPPNAVGVATPVQVVPPWDANATGAGLLRGGAAVAATPPL